MSRSFPRAAALRLLRAGFERYAPLADDTWARLVEFSHLAELRKGGAFTRPGELPTSFGFVCQGLLRGFATDPDGDQYNKVFFPEGTFPGAMVALLTGTPSAIGIEALEASWVVRIDFARYRALLRERPDLMWFQIRYLERNWLLGKEPRELALVQDDAMQRYLRFRERHPDLERRLAQYHVASHLGITPTQLSRIRRRLRESGESPDPST